MRMGQEEKWILFLTRECCGEAGFGCYCIGKLCIRDQLYDATRGISKLRRLNFLTKILLQKKVDKYMLKVFAPTPFCETVAFLVVFQ
jgi:hypothetical protein